MTHIDKNHPVRVILEQAALSGQRPTKRQLDRLDEHDLPEGESLGRFRASVDAAATRVAAARSNGYAPARELSDESWSRIADRMTPTQTAVTGDANPEPIEDIAARMFRH